MLKKDLYGNKSLHRSKKCLGFSVGCTRYVCTWYLRTSVGYVLCTTYVQPGISSYVPGMSRLPRYVYVDTYEPGLHPPPKKDQNTQHTYQHVCTWYQPAPKIRRRRYLCTRATSPPQKKNRRPIDEIAPKKQNKNQQPKYRALPSSSTKQSAQQRVRKKEYYRLSSTCGAPRNHTNVQPEDSHV